MRAQQVLCHVLTQMLKLLHPFMPFITEEIWQALPHEGDFLMLSDWPVADAALDFPEEEKAMELIMDAIRAVRTRRSEMNVPPSKKAHLTVATGERDIFVLGVPFPEEAGLCQRGDLRPAGAPPRRRAPSPWSPMRPRSPCLWRSWWTWRRRRPAWRRS